jgi:ATP adenylyltransferase
MEKIMDKLWSPWRSKYIDSFKPGHVEEEDEEKCLFCRINKQDKDKENLLVHRSKNCYIVMNRYPYNSGHLLIVPYAHASSLNELDQDTYLDCMNMLNLSCEILSDTIFPHGFNIGANIGRDAGAGIAEHIHFHIVPRWNGDTNFMPVLNDIKVVSEQMEDTYVRLINSLKKHLK